MIKEMIICKSCKETHSVDIGHHHCNACSEDLTRISKSKDISHEIKRYIILHYTQYLNWLIKQNDKPEWNANYHSFQDTCETFYITDTAPVEEKAF